MDWSKLLDVALPMGVGTATEQLGDVVSLTAVPEGRSLVQELLAERRVAAMTE